MEEEITCTQIQGEPIANFRCIVLAETATPTGQSYRLASGREMSIVSADGPIVEGVTPTKSQMIQQCCSGHQFARFAVDRPDTMFKRLRPDFAVVCDPASPQFYLRADCQHYFPQSGIIYNAIAGLFDSCKITTERRYGSRCYWHDRLGANSSLPLRSTNA
ncbi:uncharacterized protein L969DRAFT_50235 [Mixia osmundae IAM 14324]|uniref:Uncharacterized protein n=1 Tax=Mixia osmundae (strain CBS 9802 / IAM 14324 / JCM 22182 / KY 12970) TaxID=764103 RepID=G7E6S9_MIXOS|nr:uncharacterized protein L969DRAFT_50235 [Mixia osmundae IAM 14324]KEI39078.1 hypothetical protein L969DRAFT_50235 [Mixia osmundae IAM 14324]GAA98539.1 hypothetical protein E5Q_05226 [Mixia osmundae IAM 14324]